MVDAPTKRKLTADEYQRMGETGVLGRDERVELLDGEIYEMPPISDGHVGAVNRSNFRFTVRLGNRAIVSVQNPIRLSDFSEPQPDLAILRPDPHFYGTRRVRPEDVLLLIEVADSSLEYDRTGKLPRYAAAGILEVWIVNVSARHIEVYRRPAGGGYTEHSTHVPGETLTLVALPEIAIAVEEILG